MQLRKLPVALVVSFPTLRRGEVVWVLLVGCCWLLVVGCWLLVVGALVFLTDNEQHQLTTPRPNQFD